MDHDRLVGIIKERAIRHLPREQLQTVNVYLDQRRLQPREPLMAWDQEIPVTRDSMMVFVDEEPMANWSHRCRYLLFGADDGELYEEVEAGFPPTLLEPDESFEAFHKPVVVRPYEREVFALPKRRRFPLLRPDGRRYAILFSGASNNRHVNDLEFLYRTLIDQYYFEKEDIYVLNYDGTINYSGGPKPVTAWPGDGTSYEMAVSGPGTKSDFEGVIDDLKKRMGSKDLLLIHSNNHGGHDGTNSYICSYSGPADKYTAPSFAGKVAELPKIRDLVVIMEQCRSGGFNDIVIENSPADRTSFSAACAEFRNSIGGADFDPFARDWISSLAGVDPYGSALAFAPDVSGEGRVSALEAFAYADRLHHSYDSPVYSERGEGAADAFLQQRWTFAEWIEVVQPVIDEMWAERTPSDYWDWASHKLEPRLRELEGELGAARLSTEEIRGRLERTVREAA